MSKFLATIKIDVPAELNLEELKLHFPESQQISALEKRAKDAEKKAAAFERKGKTAEELEAALEKREGEFKASEETLRADLEKHSKLYWHPLI